MAYNYVITHKGKAPKVSSNKILKYEAWPSIAMLTSSEPFSAGWPFLEVFNLDTSSKIFSVTASAAFQYTKIARNDNHGNLWFGLISENTPQPVYTLFKYSLSGSKILELQLGTASGENCYYITIDNKQNIYAAGVNKIYKFDNNGTLLDYVDRPYKQPQLGITNPIYLEYADNHIFVVGDVGINSYLWKYDTDLNLQWTFYITTSNYPYSFDVDYNGYSYIGYGTTVVQVTPSGATGWSSTGGGSSIGGNSTATDRQNNVYLSRASNTPLKYSSAGVTQSMSGPSLSIWFDVDSYDRVISVDSVNGSGANPKLDTIKINSSTGASMSSFTFSSVVTTGLANKLTTYKWIR